MNGYKVPFYVTAALLLASLAVQLRSFDLLGPDAATPRPSESAPDASAPPSGLASAAAELRAAKLEVLRLRSELVKCQDQNWDMAADLARGMLDPREVPASTDDTAKSTMCAVSGWVLRKQWEHGAVVVGAILGQELGTEAWVNSDLEQRFQRLGADQDLGQRDKDELERGYRGIWHRHGERMRRQAAAGDWNGVADSLRTFWQEEDDMVNGTLGADRASSFADSEAPLRTTLLALFATYADAPWDESTLSP